ncbi:MAG: Fe-S cluster assembly sulfur transfer protein SufU [Fidelibacterota bacterium]
MSRPSSGDDLRELYQQLILDHNQNPRNFKILMNANRMAEGFNPLCGDKVTVYVRLVNDVIEDMAFQGSGCAISKASASIMTLTLKGRTKKEAEALFEAFRRMVTTGEKGSQDLQKLTVLAGVYKYPVRVKCATLAWHTMMNSLQEKREAVSTE